MEVSESIPVHVSNGKAYVWTADDVGKIRSKYRLTGLLIGTLPSVTQQNIFLGLPLLLLPEEATLLLELGAITLVNNTSSHPTPTTAQLSKWISERDASVSTQIETRKKQLEREEGKAAYKGSITSDAAQKKRKEREERKNALPSASHIVDELFEPPTPPLTASSPLPAVPTAALDLPHTVLIPTTSSSLPWYDPSSSSYTSLSSAKEAGVWTYPNTKEEISRYKCFKYLWEKGYWLGGGMRFGGDWLVYPGDPLRYHSHFVASVYSSPKEVINPMEIVAHGRLGTGTKKAHLMVSWDEEREVVDCYSIEWAGFG